jgi:hypothetical protein
MSVEDAIGMGRGGDTAASDFFAAKTRAPLTQAFSPVVQPRKVHEHVTDKALDGVFLLLAHEERKLRADPLAAGSASLNRVFGQ